MFEKDKLPGGSFRYAGKAPLFQEVEASERSFARYIADMTAACIGKGVVFRFSTDVAAQPELLAPFDRIVIATGADYRFGLGPLAKTVLDWGGGRWPGLVAAVLHAEAARLVLLSGPPRHRRTLQAPHAPGTDGHRDRRRSSRPARASRRSPAHSRPRFFLAGATGVARSMQGSPRAG